MQEMSSFTTTAENGGGSKSPPPSELSQIVRWWEVVTVQKKHNRHSLSDSVSHNGCECFFSIFLSCLPGGGSAYISYYRKQNSWHFLHFFLVTFSEFSNNLSRLFFSQSFDSTMTALLKLRGFCVQWKVRLFRQWIKGIGSHETDCTS